MKAGDPLIQAFKHVTFGLGTSAKRWANTVTAWPPERELTPNGEAFAWLLAYTYRRQLPPSLAMLAEAKKINHLWVAEKGVKFGRYNPMVCDRCGHVMMSERSRNSPCIGHRPVERKKRVRKAKPENADNGKKFFG